MTRANEIYNFSREIERELKRIRESRDVNKDTILDFHNHSVAEGLSMARIVKRVTIVRYLSDMLGMKFQDAKKSDIVSLVAKIEGKDHSEWTKSSYKKILKHFYKWLKDSDSAPPEVSWIKCKTVSNNLMKKDLLTPEEANLIIENASTIQEKALFSVLFDSGRRLGEILGLRIGDIEFDSIGAKLRVCGKVGEDIVRICASQPRLALWCDNHPARDNPESPLWVSVRIGGPRQMSYNSAAHKLKNAVKKAGIKKRVWYYLFRHSRITPASTRLTYAEMCHVFGWKQGSDMPQFYVHLSGDDRDNAFLKMNGMSPAASDNAKSEYSPLICPRCGRNNSPDAKYCNGCGLAFDLKYATEFDRRKEDVKQKIETLSTELARSPEVLDTLIGALITLKKDSHGH